MTAAPSGIIPATRGFNASLGTSSQHDSTNGWSSILNPNIAYRFNKYFSVDAGTPIYIYINVDANVGTKAKPVFGYRPKKGVFGDTSLAFETDVTALVGQLQPHRHPGPALRQHRLWTWRRAGDLQHQQPL